LLLPRDHPLEPTVEPSPEATVAALMSVIPYFRIKPGRAKAILNEVDRAVSAWREHGRHLGMTPNELEAFADAFEHAERAAARSCQRRVTITKNGGGEGS
jgi:serine/threonine-protein kinase HipA